MQLGEVDSFCASQYSGWLASTINLLKRHAQWQNERPVTSVAHRLSINLSVQTMYLLLDEGCRIQTHFR